MRHVIITGGSSGIGAALASLCCGRGDAVSLIARGEAALEQTKAQLEARQAGARVGIQAADVTDAEAVRAAISACESAFGPCDLLITSAGIVHPGRFEELPAARFEEQVRVNLFGTVNAARAVYPGMVARGRGHILMIGSGASLIGIYGYSAYCASKFAVLGFAEALRFEARTHGVGVSICFPPDTQTPQLAAELPLRPREAAAIVETGGEWSAEAVAQAAMAGVDRGKFVIYAGMQLRLLGLFGSLALPFLRPGFDRRIARMKRAAPG